MERLAVPRFFLLPVLGPQRRKSQLLVPVEHPSGPLALGQKVCQPRAVGEAERMRYCLEALWAAWAPLQEYSAYSYLTIKQHWDVLPPSVHYFAPYMIEHNWLLNYATIEGIGNALRGLSQRVSFENKMGEAVNDLQERRDEFEVDFKAFFPQLIKYAEIKEKTL